MIIRPIIGCCELELESPLFAELFFLRTAGLRYVISQTSSFNPRKDPKIRPIIIAGPAKDKALVALKNPPILQPKDRAEPIPINAPPSRPFTNSLVGAMRI